MSKLLSFLRSFFFIIFNTKKIWRKPSEKKVLIFDEASIIYRPHLMEFINTNDREVYYTRNTPPFKSVIYIYVILLMVSKFKFSKESYKKIYFKLINPKYIITLIDNSIQFYTLKKYCPDAFIISIQSSHRMAVSDFFSKGKVYKKEKLYSDLIFVFNNYVANKYKQFIKTKCVSIGSFESNNVKRKKTRKKFDILYISDFPFPFTVTKSNSDMRKEYISWDKFIAPVQNFLMNLSKYLEKKEQKLLILGRAVNPYESNLEKQYYEKIFKKNFTFIKNYENRKKFDFIDKSKIVITINSTLGYESFSRGTKTAFFSVRAKNGLFKSTRFGWPAPVSLKGPCWTNDCSINEIHRVLNSLIKMSDKKWIKFRNKRMSSVLKYDPGNKKFFKTIKNLGFPINHKNINI